MSVYKTIVDIGLYGRCLSMFKGVIFGIGKHACFCEFINWIFVLKLSTDVTDVRKEASFLGLIKQDDLSCSKILSSYCSWFVRSWHKFQRGIELPDQPLG